ncbi:MAG TPA: BON domain-containing protein [Vicinamibacterales bacterium]|nr:BON domain-containing protein [Vicinamibacterales bacterium]
MQNAMRALLGLVVVAAIPAAACNREPDVQEQVEKSLEAANLGHVDVRWDEDARIAHLTGQVESPDQRQRAEEIANAAVGTSGTVLNELTVEGMDDTVGDMDDEIRNRITELLQRDPSLRDRSIEVDVNNGAVAVTGTVADEAEKERVTKLVQSAPGVTDFANRLEIDRTEAESR